MRIYFILFVFLVSFATPLATQAAVDGGVVNQTQEPAVSGGIVNTNPQTYIQNQSNRSSNVTLINPLNTGACNSNGTCLESFLTNILQVVIRIGAIIVVLMLVFVGYKFVAAQGEPGAISEARRMLLWTVVGALILLGAQAIALGIKATVTALGG